MGIQLNVLLFYIGVVLTICTCNGYGEEFTNKVNDAQLEQLKNGGDEKEKVSDTLEITPVAVQNSETSATIERSISLDENSALVEEKSGPATQIPTIVPTTVASEDRGVFDTGSVTFPPTPSYIDESEFEKHGNISGDARSTVESTSESSENFEVSEDISATSEGFEGIDSSGDASGSIYVSGEGESSSSDAGGSTSGSNGNSEDSENSSGNADESEENENNSSDSGGNDENTSESDGNSEDSEDTSGTSEDSGESSSSVEFSGSIDVSGESGSSSIDAGGTAEDSEETSGTSDSSGASSSSGENSGSVDVSGESGSSSDDASGTADSESDSNGNSEDTEDTNETSDNSGEASESIEIIEESESSSNDSGGNDDSASENNENSEGSEDSSGTADNSGESSSSGELSGSIDVSGESGSSTSDEGGTSDSTSESNGNSENSEDTSGSSENSGENGSSGEAFGSIDISEEGGSSSNDESSTADSTSESNGNSEDSEDTSETSEDSGESINNGETSESTDISGESGSFLGDASGTSDSTSEINENYEDSSGISQDSGENGNPEEASSTTDSTSESNENSEDSEDTSGTSDNSGESSSSGEASESIEISGESGSTSSEDGDNADNTSESNGNSNDSEDTSDTSDNSGENGSSGDANGYIDVSGESESSSGDSSGTFDTTSESNENSEDSGDSTGTSQDSGENDSSGEASVSIDVSGESGSTSEDATGTVGNTSESNGNSEDSEDSSGTSEESGESSSSGEVSGSIDVSGESGNDNSGDSENSSGTSEESGESSNSGETSENSEDSEDTSSTSSDNSEDSGNDSWSWWANEISGYSAHNSLVDYYETNELSNTSALNLYLKVSPKLKGVCGINNVPMVQQAFKPVYTTGNGLTWDIQDKRIYLADVSRPSINQYDPNTGKMVVMKLSSTTVKGIILTTTKDEYVMVTDNLIVLVKGSFKEDSSIVRYKQVLFRFYPVFRMGVPKVDNQGRVWLAVWYQNKTDKSIVHQKFYMIYGGELIEKKVEARKIEGMAWSKDSTKMYLTDSITGSICSYKFNEKTGDISELNVLFKMKNYPNLTGRLLDVVVDSQNELWVPLYGGGAVINIDPESGKLKRVISLPTTYPASLAFGDNAQDKLFVSSSYQESHLTAVPYTYVISGTGATGISASKRITISKVFNTKKSTMVKLPNGLETEFTLFDSVAYNCNLKNICAKSTAKVTGSCPAVKSEPYLQEVSTPAETKGSALHWDKNTASLYYVDKFKASVVKFNPESGKHVEITIKDISNVATNIPVRNMRDTYLVVQEKSFVLLNNQYQKDGSAAPYRQLITALNAPNVDVIFTIGKVDLMGRLYIGTELQNDKRRHLCHLYRLTGDNLEVLDNNITRAGGTAVSLNRTTFYLADFGERLVYKYDFDETKGNISNREVMFDLREYPELEGTIVDLAVDSEDHIWATLYNGGSVLRFDPVSRKVVTRIALPTRHPVSLEFGGVKRDVLFVSSNHSGPCSCADQSRFYAISNLGVTAALGEKTNDFVY